MFCDRCHSEIFNKNYVSVQARRFSIDDYPKYYEICGKCWDFFICCKEA